VDILSTPENAEKIDEQEELDHLLRALGGNKLPLRDLCMKGTRQTILQEIEEKVKSSDGHNIIWIRGSPGVGKSALAASISAQLLDQGRHVISFRFDRTQSTTITTNALWRFVASDLVRWYPSLCKHLVKANEKLSTSDINRLFELFVKIPLSTLDNDIPHEELPVIVIDALDECGGFRRNSSEREDFEGLLCTLRCWAEVGHLRKFKLIITSRLDECITSYFPENISTHINIPSGSSVELGASNDIRAFLKERLQGTGMADTWVNEALDYLVHSAAGMFIWAKTAAEFLRENTTSRFYILKTRKQENSAEVFKDLYSLYSTVIETSLKDISKQEAEAITSVMGAMIFAKQPLDKNALMMLPGVRNPDSHEDMLEFILKRLVSVIDIDSDSTLHFHHRSFTDFLLHPSFSQRLGGFSAIQDRDLHERQLAVLCLNTMVSPELHFNMCDLESSNIKNVDIPATNKSALSPLISYSSQFWADHLVQAQHEILMKRVKFIMYEKLLFWIEVMSILGKAHEASAVLKKALEWPALAVCPEFVFYNTSLRLTG